MNNNNLRKALEASRFYHAQRYEAMRPMHEIIQMEKKQLLIGLYQEVAELEARLCAMEGEFGYKYDPSQLRKSFSYVFKDDDGGGDDGGDDGSSEGDGGGNDDGDGGEGGGDHYDPDEPRVPAGSPDGGQWTSGGGSDLGAGTQYADSGQVMDDAGNIYPADSSLPKPDGIPDDWMTRPSRDGTGIRYTDPNNTGNEVRTMPGDPGSDYPTSQEPYVRWMNNGQFLDKAGNITTDPAEYHIPLEDFEFMPEIFLP